MTEKTSTTTFHSDHPALQGMGYDELSHREFERHKRAVHSHLMNGQGMACYCYQELMRVYNESKRK